MSLMVFLNKKIKCNKIKCNYCGDVIESKTVHDFVYCSCKKVAVDGGKDYLKRIYTKDLNTDYVELSEFEK